MIGFIENLQMTEETAYENLDNFRSFVKCCDLNEYDLPGDFQTEWDELWQVKDHFVFLLHWYYSTQTANKYSPLKLSVIEGSQRFLLDQTASLPVPSYGELLCLRYGANFDAAGVVSSSKRLQTHCALIMKALQETELAPQNEVHTIEELGRALKGASIGETANDDKTWNKFWTLE